MPKILVCAALLLLSARPSHAQWERVETTWTGKEGIASRVLQSSARPFQFYLTPAPERDPTNSLCLGCLVSAGSRQRTLQDFEVETTERTLGESFGRKIFQIVLSFRDKNAPATTSEEPGPIQWKSIVMESSPNAYRELYLLIDDGSFVQHLSEASVFAVGGAQVLGTIEYLTGNAVVSAESYWILEPNGPRLIDFTAVDNAIKKIIPSDTEIHYRSLDVKQLELSCLAQRKNAECQACDYLGWATVRFRLDGHRAIPVSSSFVPYQDP